ncbi:MAG TPA: hypothetical protein VF363_12695 [Candidatus Eisenbacteria bacterium]
MKTAASEHLSQEQIMSRLSATFSALIREQIEVVGRFLDSEAPDLESSDLGPIVELAVRLVERSAEWLDVTEVASLALELRETLSNLGQLRPMQRQEMVAHCRVALTAEAKLADQLRTEGFAALLAHAASVGEAVEQLRAGLHRVKADAAASRGMIDDGTPDVGPHENLLALTFEIKNALVHQNDRIGAMSETVGETLRSAQTVLSEWETIVKAVERRRMQSGGKEDPALPDGKTLHIHQELQETTSGLRTLTHELSQLMGLQYSLERRARDLDEYLLWEFLDPLDRFVDDFYTAASCHDGGARRTVLTVQTGGVGFEPEIGSILHPLLLRLLESMEPYDLGDGGQEIRFTAVREGLEARIALEGKFRFDVESVRLLENALEGLGGFATMEGGEPKEASLRIQFPMARSLRSFLIVEANGQRIALPWSAVERIHASSDELRWTGHAGPRTVHPLAAIFGRGDSGAGGAVAEPAGVKPSDADGPLAVLRCGGGSALLGFDRIVWRENARLTALPPRLYPVEEVLGGIVTPDSSVTLVLNPAAIVRRLSMADARGGAAA